MVTFVSGNFNILHPGHLRLLRYAYDLGDQLVVGVYSDRLAGEHAFIAEHDRLTAVGSIAWVDNAFIIDEPIENILLQVKPNFIVKGKEYEHAHNVEKNIVSQYGGRLVFSSGQTTFSSLDLIQQSIDKDNVGWLDVMSTFLSRYNIDKNTLKEIVSKFDQTKICIIGDLIIDEYIECEPVGMSQEEPTIVVTPIESRQFVGGAGIVAAHAASLGADVMLLSVTGVDGLARFARESLEHRGVAVRVVEDNSRDTTLKQRFRAGGKSLLRVNRLQHHSISIDLQRKLMSMLEAYAQTVDVLVFADFNYGCLPQNLVEQITEFGKRNSIKMLADSQSSSQIGNIGRFVDMDLITPTEREARLSLRNNQDGLVILAEELRKNARAESIFLTLGAEGLFIYASGPSGEQRADQLPALNQNPKDVVGAGDSLLACAALCLAVGTTVPEAAVLGSLSAALQVSNIGNTAIARADLLAELNK